MTSSDWTKLVEIQYEIVNSREAHPQLGLPQPSWVGNNYSIGGVLIVGINPGNGNLTSKLNTNEKRFQESLRQFKKSGLVEDYKSYVNEVHNQAPSWARWKRFGEALLQGASLNIDQIGWVNSWKYRTDTGSPDWSSPAFRQHIKLYLFNELKILEPIFVVTHGGWAKFALEEYNKIAKIKIVTCDISQRGSGSSQADALQLGQRIGKQLRKPDDGIL